MNKALVAGRLGMDPEVRVTAGGREVAKFSLATSERRKDPSGEVKEFTTWHRVVAWDGYARVARDYLKKGSFVLIEARIHNDSYEDRDGRKVPTSELIVLNIELTPRGDSSSSGNRPPEDRGTGQAPPQEQAPPPRQEAPDGVGGGFSDDDLPF